MPSKPLPGSRVKASNRVGTSISERACGASESSKKRDPGFYKHFSPIGVPAALRNSQKKDIPPKSGMYPDLLNMYSPFWSMCPVFIGFLCGRSLPATRRQPSGNPTANPGKDNLDPAHYVHNENPPLVALGKKLGSSFVVRWVPVWPNHP